MLFTSVSVVLGLSLSVFASPTGKDVSFSKKSVVEKINGPPAGWARDESIQVDKDAEMVKLRIHLVQQGMSDFHELAMKVGCCPNSLNSANDLPRFPLPAMSCMGTICLNRSLTK